MSMLKLVLITVLALPFVAQAGPDSWRGGRTRLSEARFSPGH